MPSLSVHLRLPDDHSSLPFHPSCPVCRRDRLAGSLSGDELVSRRTQAAITAGLIAFSAIGAPAAAAQDPDTVSEGTAETVDSADPDSFEIGGDTVELSDEASPTPEVAAPLAEDEDAGPVELERESESIEPVVAPTNEVTAPSPTEAPPPPAPAPVPAPSAEVPAVTSAPDAGDIRAEASKRVNVARERRAKDAPEASRVVAVATEPAAVAAAAPAVAPASPAPTTVRVVAGASSGRAAPGDRFHTVRRGESLWSIAADVLGERASVGQIAREVNRLWELNEERIASGDPNLLFAGTGLRLR
jgi:nucleoid-associated protein YgaU